jgi:hypothetical protein
MLKTVLDYHKTYGREALGKLCEDMEPLVAKLAAEENLKCSGFVWGSGTISFSFLEGDKEIHIQHDGIKGSPIGDEDEEYYDTVELAHKLVHDAYDELCW